MSGLSQDPYALPSSDSDAGPDEREPKGPDPWIDRDEDAGFDDEDLEDEDDY